MALLQNAGKDIPHLSIVEILDEFTSTACGDGSFTHLSLSMLVSDMMPPKHQHPLRGEMYMQLLVPRISILLKNPMKTIFLKILTPHQMTFISYIRPNIAENPPHHYLASRKITPESLPLLHPRSLLRNMMDLSMSLLRSINSSPEAVVSVYL